MSSVEKVFKLMLILLVFTVVLASDPTITGFWRYLPEGSFGNFIIRFIKLPIRGEIAFVTDCF